MRPIFLRTLLAFLAALLLPTAGHAYCSWWIFDCETYLVYDSVNNAISGYSYTNDTTDNGFWIGVSAQYTSPLRTVDYDEVDGYGFVEIDYGPWDGSGEYTADAVHTWNGEEIGESGGSVEADQPLPTDETSEFDYWDGTYGGFFQTLTGSSNWAGEQVEEEDGGGGADGCWFAGSLYSPWVAITGGIWSVEGGNQWGDDWIGWDPGPVSYYRSQGQAPCSNTMPQVMQIYTSSSPQPYTSNTLHAGIGTSTVWSSRNGAEASESW